MPTALPYQIPHLHYRHPPSSPMMERLKQISMKHPDPINRQLSQNNLADTTIAQGIEKRWWHAKVSTASHFSWARANNQNNRTTRPLEDGDYKALQEGAATISKKWHCFDEQRMLGGKFLPLYICHSSRIHSEARQRRLKTVSSFIVLAR